MHSILMTMTTARAFSHQIHIDSNEENVLLLQDDEPLVLNDEEDLKRQQAAERARERQERLRDA